MDMSQLLQFLKGLGSAQPLNKTFDCCGKFLGISAPKSIEKLGVRREVSEAEFVDAKGGRVTVSVRDRANRTLQVSAASGTAPGAWTLTSWAALSLRFTAARMRRR